MSQENDEERTPFHGRKPRQGAAGTSLQIAVLTRSQYQEPAVTEEENQKKNRKFSGGGGERKSKGKTQVNLRGTSRTSPQREEKGHTSKGDVKAGCYHATPLPLSWVCRGVPVKRPIHLDARKRACHLMTSITSQNYCLNPKTVRPPLKRRTGLARGSP